MTCQVLEGQQLQASCKQAAKWADIRVCVCNSGPGSGVTFEQQFRLCTDTNEQIQTYQLLTLFTKHVQYNLKPDYCNEYGYSCS